MVLIPPDAGLRMRMQAETNLLQPAAPVGEIPSDLPELRSGQTFTARIQDVLPDNTYRALVAGKQITLQLPEGAEAGDSLELVVIDRTPRVVTAKLADAATAKGPGESYQYTNLSRAGQLIGQLLLAEGKTPQPAPLNRGQPLLAQPPANAAELAPALQKAVAQSGLFYEAHQAQWAAGRLPTEQLLREPQGQRSAPAAFAEHGLPPPAPAEARAAAANTVANTNAAAPAPPPPPTLMQTLFGGAEESPAAAAPAPASAAANPAANAIPEELRPLVQQQLDAAATQRLAWHGEVWPNQAMDWEVVREDERGPESGQADETGWRTTLRLEMPHLGRVEAALRLTAAGIHVSVSAPDDAGAAGLREAAPRLASALEAAGVPLLSFQARHAAE
jgi:hypothetical protein